MLQALACCQAAVAALLLLQAAQFPPAQFELAITPHNAHMNMQLNFCGL
jgi:hypothetical protein